MLKALLFPKKRMKKYERAIELNAPHPLSIEGKIHIVVRVGEVLRNILNCDILLKDFPILSIVDSKGNYYYVNRYATERYIRGCDYPFKFLLFIEFFIDVLKEMVGPRLSGRCLGSFKLLTLNEACSLMLKIAFKRRSNFSKVRISLLASHLRNEITNNNEQLVIERVTEELRRISPFELLIKSTYKTDLYELSEKEKFFLVKSARRCFLDEIFQLLESVRPRKNNIRFTAGIDLFPYGIDLKRCIKLLVKDAERVAIGKKSKIKLNEIKNLIASLGNHEDLNIALKNLTEKDAVNILHLLKEFFLRRGLKSKALLDLTPKRNIVFKLWERDFSDVFMGDYSGTCLSLIVRGREEMPKYLKDEYTEFLRILINNKRVGHVKLFECIDEDGYDVLYIDYIALPGGKYKKLHKELLLYALSASIKLAQIKGLERVYIAAPLVSDLNASIFKKKLKKKGINVYAQFLDAPKYLIWNSHF
mgnify:CR=1 FL=1